jgi:signal peptidase II
MSRARAPRTHRPLALGIAAAVFVADQLMKWFVTDILLLREKGVIVVVSFFDLKWVQNYGISMGFLHAETDTGRWLLVALTGAISVGVLVWLWREHVKPDAVALALVLGGALGNIVDRARFGYVIDYADLHFGEWKPFLVFNVADAAITIGVLLLIVRALLTRDKRDLSENANA